MWESIKEFFSNVKEVLDAIDEFFDGVPWES